MPSTGHSSSRNYVPLGSAKTYREGFLRLQGWMTFSALAFFTAGILVAYELLVINIEDQDFRDMLFDYRITRQGVSYQHKHFANAQLCCHSDPGVPGASTNCSVSAAMRDVFAGQAPPCPPAVQFTCPDLASAQCQQLRDLLYPAAGLNSTTGQPTSCSTAGRVLLRARQAGSYVLSASGGTGGPSVLASLSLDSAGFDAAGIQAFVQQAAAAADPMFFIPRVPLSKSVSVGSQQLQLWVKWQPEGRDKFGEFGWPWELWPWPPSAGCSNTSQPATMWLEGDATVAFSPFQPNVDSSQPPLPFRLMQQPADAQAETESGQVLELPQYRILPAGSAGGSAGESWSGLGPFARDPGASAGEGLRSPSADQQQQVKVMALSGVQLFLGLVAPLGACDAWQLHRPGVRLQYGTQVWAGRLEQLPQLSTQQVAASGVMRTIAVSLHDVSEPRPLALPRYGGEIYIYAALVLGGVWMFSTAPLVMMLGVMVVNVQRNRGLPIFLYKYMREYRGW